nr:Gp49 family protein [Rhodoferax ferrireducens]
MPYQTAQAKKVEELPLSASGATIEQEIQAKGLTAPRVTLDDIKANIASEHYFTAEEGIQGALAKRRTDLGVENQALSLLTFCVLTLRNGFTVTGESACASPENFNAEIGRKIAHANAVQKIFPLMGYTLKERLYQATQPAQSPEQLA